MRKQLQKDNEGLKIYFTKREMKLYGLVEGDVLDLEDMFIMENKKSRKKNGNKSK